MRIRHQILRRCIFACALCATTTAAIAATPSFDCKRKLNDAERIICGDDTLATLDRKLGEVFQTAANSLPRDKTVAYFVAEQRDWVNDRDGCPTTRNPASCLSSVYRTRIAELQGRFHMVTSRGPFRFACEGNPPQEIVVTWYATDPPSGILESTRGQTTMFETASGSGTRYVGDDVAFAEHQGTATLAWGTTAQELACTLKK
ncbi:MAG: MliC family protein [Betaproteobacteria bacterium]